MRYGLLLSLLDEVANLAKRMQLSPTEYAVLAARAEHVAAKIRVMARGRQAKMRRPLSRQHGRA
jgi:hypothetical protein